MLTVTRLSLSRVSNCKLGLETAALQRPPYGLSQVSENSLFQN